MATAPAVPRHHAPLPAELLEALIRRHQQGTWRYLRALGAGADLAEDLLQDTMVVACQRLERDRGHAAVAAFLRRTARHLYLRHRRDAGRRERLLVALADRAWRRDCERDDGERWLAALSACVGGLEPQKRRALELSYGDEANRGAAAGELGLRENGLKTLLQRLRAGLRQCVERRLRGAV